jgi:cbb3-type cytochrome oxidase maturation protein
MDSLYLLIPLSVLLVFVVMGLFAWALHRGQFDDLEREGERILEPPPVPLDPHQQGPANGL